MKMVDLRDELKDIRTYQSVLADGVKTVEEIADAISSGVQTTFSQKEEWEPSQGFMDYSAWINELLAKQEEMFRYGVDVTTKRYEDAIADLGGKVGGLESNWDMFLEGLNVLKGEIDETKEAMQRSAFGGGQLLGGIQTIVIIGLLGLGGIVIAKELIAR